jgi:hypothetical protein
MVLKDNGDKIEFVGPNTYAKKGKEEEWINLFLKNIHMLL